MGEICLKLGSSAQSIIHVQNLSFVFDAGKVIGASITIRHYKNILHILFAYCATGDKLRNRRTVHAQKIRDPST